MRLLLPRLGAKRREGCHHGPDERSSACPARPVHVRSPLCVDAKDLTLVTKERTTRKAANA
jgi:hypothetical protein